MTIKEFEIQLALGTLSYDMKYKLANNKKTSKEVLTILSTDEYWLIRCYVAENSNTPVEVLKVLSTDENASVRSSVAYNPKEILKKL